MEFGVWDKIDALIKERKLYTPLYHFGVDGKFYTKEEIEENNLSQIIIDPHYTSIEELVTDYEGINNLARSLRQCCRNHSGQVSKEKISYYKAKPFILVAPGVKLDFSNMKEILGEFNNILELNERNIEKLMEIIAYCLDDKLTSDDLCFLNEYVKKIKQLRKNHALSNPDIYQRRIVKKDSSSSLSKKRHLRRESKHKGDNQVYRFNGKLNDLGYNGKFVPNGDNFKIAGFYDNEKFLYEAKGYENEYIDSSIRIVENFAKQKRTVVFKVMNDDNISYTDFVFEDSLSKPISFILSISNHKDKKKGVYQFRHDGNGASLRFKWHNGSWKNYSKDRVMIKQIYDLIPDVLKRDPEIVELEYVACKIREMIVAPTKENLRTKVEAIALDRNYEPLTKRVKKCFEKDVLMDSKRKEKEVKREEYLALDLELKEDAKIKRMPTPFRQDLLSEKK